MPVCGGSFEAERTNLFDRIIHTMGAAIEADTENNSVLAYWLSNTTTLLFLLQRTLRTTGSGGSAPANRRRVGSGAPSVLERFKKTLTGHASPTHEGSKEGIKGVPLARAHPLKP